MLAPNLPAMRADARQKIDSHFNAIALTYLHRDLVELFQRAASVDSDKHNDLIQREQHRQALFECLDCANTAAEITAILADL